VSLLTDTALSAFDSLPLKERLFVRARLLSAPLEILAEKAKGPRVLDVGCGHGLLCALLSAAGHEVVGLDPDERKIEWARASVGRLPKASFLVGSIHALPKADQGTFDTVTVVDVLYLLPQDTWAGFLSACRAALKPGGVLLLKEAEDDGSWRAKKALLQERVMVQVLRRTLKSGAVGFAPREVTVAALGEAGFHAVEATGLGSGYTTPHVLFEARA
jgi:2-polyprenyl-3-methyl-5-hydroxy-6-metoxy-1,4-benzoquinol methylase